jgi:hypothetical protein
VPGSGAWATKTLVKLAESPGVRVNASWIPIELFTGRNVSWLGIGVPKDPGGGLPLRKLPTENDVKGFSVATEEPSISSAGRPWRRSRSGP